ncbi:MAG TPA: sugar phosphate isomerase/epimerase [Streptosporangiaceae bacterium]|jgi:sugar phosphate isomerase/epimerase|nr:sugar phosphate isomerase/epimerase [Streptosporangiaceae bacterium]
MSNPVALQLYTVREDLAGDRAGILRRIAGFGYGAVEPYDVISDPDGLRADIDAAGLAVCSVHARPFGEQAEAVFSGIATVGADTVIVPHMPPERFADADSVGELARELNGIAAQAAGRGLRLGYHNHDFELSSLVGGRPALEILADQLDPAVLLEVDTYWAAVGGQPVPDLLRRLGERVRYLHVKDGPVTKTDPMTAVGTGKMPVAEILTASPSVEWNVVELDDCATDMMEAVAESITWLASKGLGGRAVPAPPEGPAPSAPAGPAGSR